MKPDRSRKQFVQSIRQLLNDSEELEDSDELLKDMDSEIYHDNDEDLIQYAKQYKTKVAPTHKIENRYIRSETNKNFLFPAKDSHQSIDSEKSIQSLQNVRYYRLESQNDRKSLSDHEMLACIIEEAGKLNRYDVTHLLR
jgi:hypothetical protein